ATKAIAADPVAVDSGSLAGTELSSGVRAYLGVPFAAPPVRELRWRPPQPLTPWQGTFHADRTAPECIQTLRAHDINHYFGEEATSEDCLYLNIWAPPRNAGARAVRVFATQCCLAGFAVRGLDLRGRFPDRLRFDGQLQRRTAREEGRRLRLSGV